MLNKSEWIETKLKLDWNGFWELNLWIILVSKARKWSWRLLLAFAKRSYILVKSRNSHSERHCCQVCSIKNSKRHEWFVLKTNKQFLWCINSWIKYKEGYLSCKWTRTILNMIDKAIIFLITSWCLIDTTRLIKG